MTAPIIVDGNRVYADELTYSIEIDCDDPALEGHQSRIEASQVGPHIVEAVESYFKGADIEPFAGCVYMPSDVVADTEGQVYCWKLRGVDPGEDGASMIVCVNGEMNDE